MGDLWHIPSNNTTIRPINGGGTAVTLHSTDIVTIMADGAIRLDSGGYQTATTKTRMNQCANVMRLGYSVYQEDHAWYVRVRGAAAPVPFADGMVIRPTPIG